MLYRSTHYHSIFKAIIIRSEDVICIQINVVLCLRAFSFKFAAIKRRILLRLLLSNWLNSEPYRRMSQTVTDWLGTAVPPWAFHHV